MKIAVVSSVGGHLTDLLPIAEELVRRGHELLWIVNDASPVLPQGERGYRIQHGERDLGVLWNCVEAGAIFAREQPEVVLSAGASPAVSAALAAKVLRIPVVYIEPSCTVRQLSLTGRLMRYLADSFFVQWPDTKRVAPWAKFEGGILL